MLVTSPAARQGGDAAPIAERLSAILRDEIARGALSGVAGAREVWSARRRDLVLPELSRRVAAELGGALDAVLDLVAPPGPSTAPAGCRSAGPDPAGAGDPPAEPLPVLRAPASVPPGSTAGIRTTLRNDGATPVEFGFVCSDLVGETGGRIAAGQLGLLPGRVRVAPGGSADLAIHLRVPSDARPGLYQALLRATEPAQSRALLLFLVDGDRVQEASSAM